MTTLLAGGYGPGMGGSAGGITRLRLHRDGRLEASGLLAAAPSPSWLHVAGGVLTAAGEEDGTVVSWRVDAGRLVAGPPVAAGGSPCHLALAPAGDVLLAACYGGGVLGAVPLSAGLPIGDAEIALRDAGAGPHPAQDAAHVHGSLPLTDGRVLVADLGTDQVVVIRRVDGGWRRVGALDLPPGTGPRDLVDAGPGRALLLGELSCEVVLLDTTPELPSVVATALLPGAESGDHAAALALQRTAAGIRVHSGLRGSDRIGILELRGDTLAAVGAVGCGGRWPRFVLAHDGLLLVANQLSDTVAVLALDDRELPVAVGPAGSVPSPTHLLPVDDEPWAALAPVS